MTLLRQFLIIAVVALAGGGAWWFFVGATESGPPQAGPKPQPVLVDAVPVRVGEVAEAIEAVGTTRARQSVDLRSTVTGRVAEIRFLTGQRVPAGQPLVRLDSAIEEANLAEARALRDDAGSQLERARQLVASRAVSPARVDELEAQHRVAQARLAVAERRLAERVVVAPFDGVVGLREVDVGARVTADTVLTRLDDLSVVELEFQVPELFFGRVRRGQSVEAISAALPDGRFKGTVSTIDTRIDPASRVFRVRAELPNPDGLLPGGLFMVAQVILAARSDVLIIPEQAVVPEGRSTYVFRIKDGRAERVEVRLGLRRVGEVEVAAGLALGDMVAVSGLQRLRDGAAVRLSGGPPQVDGVRAAAGGAG